MAISLEMLKMCPWCEFENYQFEMTATSPMGQWVKGSPCPVAACRGLCWVPRCWRRCLRPAPRTQGCWRVQRRVCETGRRSQDSTAFCWWDTIGSIHVPVLLPRSDAVASRLASGSAAFIWKLHCHWLRGLRWHQIAIVWYRCHYLIMTSYCEVSQNIENVRLGV